MLNFLKKTEKFRFQNLPESFVRVFLKLYSFETTVYEKKVSFISRRYMQSRKIPNIYVKRPIFLTEKEVWDLVLKNGYLHLLNYEHKRDNLALPKNFRNVACSFYKYCYYSCEKSKGKIYLKNFGEKEISLSFKGGEDKREMNIDFVNLGEKEFFLLLNHFHLLYIKSPKRLYQKEFKEMAHGAFI